MNLAKPVKLLLPEETLDMLEVQAAEKGIRPATLARMIVVNSLKISSEVPNEERPTRGNGRASSPAPRRAAGLGKKLSQKRAPRD